MNIYSPRTIDTILRERTLAPSKKRGQNFLIDRAMATRIAACTPRARGMNALEIGPGLGSLTRGLTAHYPSLTAVEYDSGFFDFLSDDATLASVRFIHNDIRNVSLADIAPNVDVYGNIPYNISSSILEWLLIANAGSWNFAILLVQNEFAKRLTALPGSEDYSALTLLGNFAATVDRHWSVPRSMFHPRPSVESAIISLVPHGRYDMQYFDAFRLLTKALFHNRRKTLRNNLLIAPHLSLTPDEADAMLAHATIPAGIRGECLDCETVYRIASRFATQLRGNVAT